MMMSNPQPFITSLPTMFASASNEPTAFVHPQRVQGQQFSAVTTHNAPETASIMHINPEMPTMVTSIGQQQMPPGNHVVIVNGQPTLVTSAGSVSWQINSEGQPTVPYANIHTYGHGFRSGPPHGPNPSMQ